MDRSQQQRDTERERKTFGDATALGEAMRRARNAQGQRINQGNRSAPRPAYDGRDTPT